VKRRKNNRLKAVSVSKHILAMTMAVDSGISKVTISIYAQGQNIFGFGKNK